MTRLIHIINKIVENILIGIFGLMVINVLWQVASRYLLGQASSFTEELARFSLIWLTLLGAAYLSGKKEHIAIDYFYNKFPEAVRGKVAVFTELLVAVFALAVLVIGGGNLVYTTLYLGQTSAALQVPMGIVYGIIPFSGVLIIFYSLVNVLGGSGAKIAAKSSENANGNEADEAEVGKTQKGGAG